MSPTAPSIQKQAVTALTGVGSIIGFDEDGNELASIAEDEGYDDYLRSMPSRDERRRLKAPERYWEVLWPGCSLQPYPTLGSFRSTPSGLWHVEYPYQAQAVRDHIQGNVHIDPDLLRISDDEWAVMDGRKEGSIRYCQDGGCRFVSCSLLATDLHESLTGHTTKNKPRED